MCQRRFYADADTAQVRYYGPPDLKRLPFGQAGLEIEDLITLTSLKTRDDGGNVDTADAGLSTWTVNTDFWLAPLNAATNSVDVWPYTRIEANPAGNYMWPVTYPRSIKVTGKFGWSSTPSPITDATTLLAERIYKMKREAPLGVIALADTAIRLARSDSNLMLMVGPYMRHRASIG